MESASVIQYVVIGLVALAATYYLVTRNRPNLREDSPESRIGEADILMAYGRKKQAIDLVTRSLQDFPENEQLKAKLKEIQEP